MLSLKYLSLNLYICNKIYFKKSLKKNIYFSDTKMAKPIYVDITYLPHHGNPEYVDELFFKHVRSKLVFIYTIKLLKKFNLNNLELNNLGF